MQSFIALMFQFIFMAFGSGASLMALYFAASGNLADAGILFCLCLCLYALSFTASPDL
jgi:hypothetical protein